MRSSKRIFCLIISVLLFLTGCNGTRNQLQKDIKSYLYDNYANEEIIVNISDFTNFEWDTLLIFKSPVSNKDIENAIGVKYERELDLEMGMIFVKDGEIIYDEMFDNDYENVSPFSIYPYEDINSGMNCNVFTPETSLFKCKKVDDGKLHGYALYPIQS